MVANYHWIRKRYFLRIQGSVHLFYKFFFIISCTSPNPIKHNEMPNHWIIIIIMANEKKNEYTRAHISPTNGIMQSPEVKLQIFQYSDQVLVWRTSSWTCYTCVCVCYVECVSFCARGMKCFFFVIAKMSIIFFVCVVEE